MIQKEEKLSALFKVTSKIISEYEEKTEEMLQTLRSTRDEQVTCIYIWNPDISAYHYQNSRSLERYVTVSITEFKCM